MITRLRFKNWRSLRDVTIDDLTPITVFIGANSSGKTNIVEALYFLHRMAKDFAPQSTYYETNRIAKIRTLGVDERESIEIEGSFDISNFEMGYGLSIQTEKQDMHFSEKIKGANSYLVQAQDGVSATPFGTLRSSRVDVPSLQISALASFSLVGDIIPDPHFLDLYRFIAGRWHFLDDNFIVSTSTPKDEKVDFFTLNRKASNLSLVLDFMRERYPEIYSELQHDLIWLLSHVDTIETETDERETRFLIREKLLANNHAPTISTGTARILAMLATYYVLDMSLPELPGLVVIEEPDTALNPGLLERFVEQLRTYTEREGYPRQFILTTHNPSFLNYFKPEEVRVVERDEQGYTTVKRIPDHVSEIWLDKFGLGEVWTTRSFGGVPE